MEDEDQFIIDDEDCNCVYQVLKEHKPVIRTKFNVLNYKSLSKQDLRKEVTSWITTLMKGKSKTLAADIEKTISRSSEDTNDYILRVKRLTFLSTKKTMKEALKEACFMTNDPFSVCRDEYEEQEKQEIKKLQTPLEIAESSLFTCKRCGTDKTYYYSMQIRRADEPPTVFITCMNKDCRYSWREG
jgi:DNA-directed RNA polymerase subunit M/transcription elongation factor TFIIS